MVSRGFQGALGAFHGLSESFTGVRISQTFQRVLRNFTSVPGVSWGGLFKKPHGVLGVFMGVPESFSGIPGVISPETLKRLETPLKIA